MPLTASEKSSIESKKRSIDSLKLDIQHLTEKKKQISEKYAKYIENTDDAARKSSYRASKISETASVANDITEKILHV